MRDPEQLLYSRNHLWVEQDDENNVFIGLTDFAQERLGDILSFDLPEIGDELEVGEVFADIESVRTAEELLAPVSGTVEDVNERLHDVPEEINELPYESWLLQLSDVSGDDDLISPEEYEDLTEEERDRLTFSDDSDEEDDE